MRALWEYGEGVRGQDANRDGGDSDFSKNTHMIPRLLGRQEAMTCVFSSSIVRLERKTTKGSFEKLHIDRKNLLFHCENHQDAHQGKSSNQCKGAESVKHLLLLCQIKS